MAKVSEPLNDYTQVKIWRYCRFHLVRCRSSRPEHGTIIWTSYYICPEVFCKKSVLKYFTCIVKHLCWSLSLIKRLQHRCFPMNFAKFLRTSGFTEHLRATAPVNGNITVIIHVHIIACFSFDIWGVFRTLRSSRPQMFLRKVVVKICSKFTWKHPCWSVISIKFHSNS